jgi:2,4-dienoyl-CoA reductase-like NADH-dependent reductase (Old Yellow Enzyme family)
VRALVQRFGDAAKVVKKAGFTGVQIHGAHGYLVSQFLSPHHNVRTDDWGGTPEKRRRFVLEVYAAMRKAVGKKYPIGVKLNSARLSARRLYRRRVARHHPRPGRCGN